MSGSEVRVGPRSDRGYVGRGPVGNIGVRGPVVTVKVQDLTGTLGSEIGWARGLVRDVGSIVLDPDEVVKVSCPGILWIPPLGS